MQSKMIVGRDKKSPFLDGDFAEQSECFEIILASHYGMCFGVRDAIALTEERAMMGEVTVLGELVHNERVREKMQTLGVREGDLFGPRATTREVLVTAHGASDQEKDRWRKMGYALQDSTCPLVGKAHSALASLVAEGHFPVVIGRKGHIEVKGLTGDFPEACVIECSDDLETLPTKRKFGVVSQTTQPIERVQNLVKVMRDRFPESEVNFKDTVCQPTKNRQRALGELLEWCDLVIVVGGSNSNNSRELVKTAQRAGVDSLLISNAGELSQERLRGKRCIGVTAGTSTQKSCVESVILALQKLGGRRRDL